MDIALGYVPRSGIVGSYGKSMFNLLRNCQTFPQLQHFTIPPAVNKDPSFYRFLPTFFFLIMARLSVKWYLIMVFVSISLTASDLGHFFSCA